MTRGQKKPCTHSKKSQGKILKVTKLNEVTKRPKIKYIKKRKSENLERSHDIYANNEIKVFMKRVYLNEPYDVLYF